jgi:hypothetical protein
LLDRVGGSRGIHGLLGFAGQIVEDGVREPLAENGGRLDADVVAIDVNLLSADIDCRPGIAHIFHRDAVVVDVQQFNPFSQNGGHVGGRDEGIFDGDIDGSKETVEPVGIGFIDFSGCGRNRPGGIRSAAGRVCDQISCAVDEDADIAGVSLDGEVA